MTDEMPLDGQYVAVLDRFEDDVAVLLLEDGERIVAERYLDRDGVPADGRHQDAVFTVRLRDGELVDIWYDSDETTDRRERAADRFERLSERLPRDDETEQGNR